MFIKPLKRSLYINFPIPIDEWVSVFWFLFMSECLPWTCCLLKLLRLISASHALSLELGRSEGRTENISSWVSFFQSIAHEIGVQFLSFGIILHFFVQFGNSSPQSQIFQLISILESVEKLILSILVLSRILLKIEPIYQCKNTCIIHSQGLAGYHNLQTLRGSWNFYLSRW